MVNNFKIGIAVTTTPNRESVFNEWKKHFYEVCSELPLYIHNDYDYKGVSYSKNRCLDKLYFAGCDYFFLFDDDCFITSPNWYDQYIKSGLNHACWNYNRLRLATRMFYANQDDKHPSMCWEYDKPNGCMLYATRKVIDVVGGWDTEFKGYGYEHPNWSDRIFNNGLTPARYIDIPNSQGLFRMADCESSFSSADRAQIPANYELYQQKYYSKEFKQFK